VILGSAFLLVRVPRETKRLSREAGDENPLTRGQRFNVGLVLFVSQASQVLIVSLTVGLFFTLFGLGYAMSYLANRIPGQAASAGVVMLAALPVILGVQFLLQAMNFDVLNVPSRPIHPYLNVLRELETEE
jgi:hypothetical protein